MDREFPDGRTLVLVLEVVDFDPSGFGGCFGLLSFLFGEFGGLLLALLGGFVVLGELRRL